MHAPGFSKTFRKIIKSLPVCLKLTTLHLKRSISSTTNLFGFLLAEWSWRRHLLASGTGCDWAEPEEFDRVGRCC